MFHWREPAEDCLLCRGTSWLPTDSALAWVRALRDQCVTAGVAFLFKQWGGPTAKAGGRLLDGQVWHQFPDGTGGVCPADQR
jgi:protein gp37